MRMTEWRSRACMAILVMLVLASCSTTRNLPEGEYLYVGQKRMAILDEPKTPVGQKALEEVEAAVAAAPNGAFLGSSSLRWPLPLGLWIHSGLAHSEKGLGKWIHDHFASNPVLLSSVNPGVRAQAAGNVLKENGYFRGHVFYETIPHPRDSLKLYLKYYVDMGIPYRIDTVFFKGFQQSTMDVFRSSKQPSLLHGGIQFNVSDLDQERVRLSNLLRNAGRYYFRSSYMTYQADTTQVSGGHVSLRLVPIEGMPKEAEKPFFLGRTTVDFLGSNGEAPRDSIYSGHYLVRYTGKLPVRARMLRRWIDYQNYRFKKPVEDSTLMSSDENLYSLHRQERIEQRLSSVGIFRYKELTLELRGGDPLKTDTLDLYVRLMMDRKYNAELDFNAKLKSNNQAGPGASLRLTRYNVFRGGESLSIGLEGSYEWQTGKNSTSDLNSYEVGLNGQVTFPRLILPWLHDVEFDFPANTSFNLSGKTKNLPKYYNQMAFEISANYDFQPSSDLKHSLTALKLVYNMLSHETEAFKKLKEETPALYMSLRSQYIPTVEYTLTYDNSTNAGVRHPLWWQTTVSEAGNLLSLGGAALGHSMRREGKEFLGVPFAQFLKVVSELRYHRIISNDVMLAFRVIGGIVWTYGNSSTAPYNEQFYIGGPNSVRSYSARNVGPGGFPPDLGNRYSYINHVGDLRLEANAELRFRIVNDLHGAAFLDAGNVWLLRQDPLRPGAQFSVGNLLKQTALGTGVGLRYDMDYLVLRLDLGVALHHPYDTGKKGYFNISKLKDGLALHFAIGYPF